MSLDDLPPSATPFERALSLGDLDSYVTRAFDPELIRRVKNPALSPIELLPYLAWERSLHEWDPAWPEWRKRNAVADSFDLHKRYGTRWGVERALDQLGIGAELDEWFEYAGRPYCFRIRIPVPEGWTNSQTTTVYRVAFGAKNARSYLDGLLLEATPPPANILVGTLSVRRSRIYATTGSITAHELPPASPLVGTVSVRRARLYAVISEAVTALAFPAAETFTGTVALRRVKLYATVPSAMPSILLPPAAPALRTAAVRRARVYASI